MTFFDNSIQDIFYAVRGFKRAPLVDLLGRHPRHLLCLRLPGHRHLNPIPGRHDCFRDGSGPRPRDRRIHASQHAPLWR